MLVESGKMVFTAAEDEEVEAMAIRGRNFELLFSILGCVFLCHAKIYISYSPTNWNRPGDEATCCWA
ncbi:MAG: hypothetical protein QXE01_07365 [Sulfolobales archaeon]